ncbi:MAG: TetR/AcrR family transcriptional regulator [Acidobacteriaceae bacterium]|nr:TetR/AcrR family transcriptional regulator [Acidobacteriaceae bacterium]
MAGAKTAIRKRLTREESRAQTRATLIDVGRKHFLRYGLGGAVAEKIAEDAGYSRGALYCNFDGKEELFLAVLEAEQARREGIFESVMEKSSSTTQRLRLMRDAIADMVTDRDWIVLRAEFEAGALINESIRKAFITAHREQIRDGGDCIREFLTAPEITVNLTPDDFIMVMMNLTHGLAVTQRILGAELSQKTIRKLIKTLFDLLITAE